MKKKDQYITEFETQYLQIMSHVFFCRAKPAAHIGEIVWEIKMRACT